MLFIVTATIAHLERGIEYDNAKAFPVTHAVEAVDKEEATSILHRHYEQQSDTESPYGARYSVSDATAFPPLSLASLSLPVSDCSAPAAERRRYGGRFEQEPNLRHA